MTISRAQMMKELEPGLNALFGLAYAEYADETNDIYGGSEPSNRAFEEEVKLSGFSAAPVKPEGEGISYDTSQEHFTARYNHETVAMGFSITEEAVEDNLYDAIASRNTKALARAMVHTKQIKGAFPLNNAFATTNFSAGDSNALCASRTTVGGGTVTNVLPTPADLNETSLEEAVIAIAAFKDERGLLIAAQPRRLLVHSFNQFAATRILESDLRSGTGDNDPNALRTNGSIPEGYFINHYFTSTNQKNWFIITDCPNGMKHFERKSLENGMDNDFDTGNYRYKARERYSFGVSDYLGIYGSGAVT